MARNRVSDRMALADVRSTLRSLRRAPGFTLLAAVTLGLGAGVAGALFALLQSVVLEPLPVADESSLVVAWGDHRTRDFEHFPFTRAVRERVAEGARGVEAVAGVEASGARERLVESGGAGDRLTPMRWSRVLGDFFGVLGVVPAAGRTLAASDDVLGGPGVAVISHELWQRRWGGRDEAVGATLTVGGAGDGRLFTVVGVAPPGFDYPRGTEVWTPIRPWFPGAAAEPPRLELDLVARLSAGRAPAAGREGFAAELARLTGSDPELAEVYSDVEPVVRPLRDVVLGDLRPVVVLLFAGGVLLLLVAGVDVANLVLLRSGERARDQALRRALGAGRAHLSVAPVVEALVITALAGGVAVLVARGGLALFLPLAPEGLPRLDRVAPGAGTWRLLAGVLALACALLATIPRLRRPSAAALGAMLRSGARADDRRRGPRRWIVAGQAALAVWAGVTAVLLVQSLSNLVSLDPGFREEGLHVVQLDHPHPYFQVPAGWPERAASAMASLERVPGVVAATPVMAPPLTGSGAFDVVPTLEGRPTTEGQVPYLNFELTLPGYFETLGLSVRRGRLTAPEDRAGAPPVVVVNESAARALWPGDEALGQHLRMPFPGYEDTVWTVVGVVADARYRAFPEVRPSLYAPLHQMPIIAPRWVAMRTAREGAPGDLLGPVAAAFADADSGVRVVGGAPVGERMAAPLARPRLALAVLGTLAGIVLLLAAVGTYGAVAASVRGRTREMGVRMACGATAGDVGGLILREALTLAAAGVAAGAAAALASGRFVESLLYGVGARDPRALAVAAAVVLATTLAACLAPAWRAARTDPREALQSEG